MRHGPPYEMTMVLTKPKRPAMRTAIADAVRVLPALGIGLPDPEARFAVRPADRDLPLGEAPVTYRQGAAGWPLLKVL